MVTIALGSLCPGLVPCVAPWRFTDRYGIYVDEVLRAVYGAALNKYVEL